ncbi:MAG TPA: hypothetical protein PKM27_07355 [Saprospiraceae bacterium]|nr:hypothetical protein [Saprospiraceae bacterium]HNT20965.1 hypothetical protein [Saprospiraceae bacterium]
MDQVPEFVSAFFILTALLTLYLFFRAAFNSRIVVFILLAWLSLQGFIASTGFYTLTDAFPPRLLLGILPPLVFIVVLFVSPKGRLFIDGLDLKALILVHMVRIPVELVLFWLFSFGTIPQLMTFEGRNFDVLSGISALPVYYFGFIKKSLDIKFILAWNYICLALLANIVIHALFSFPYPFQLLAFDQPNIALLYFPFLWLPAVVVPLVLFSHLAAIRQLRRKQ